MPKISICMMVKDEEKNIRRCLDSIKILLTNDFAELIVVDTGSIDKTPDIVKEYTNNLHFHSWNNNFAEMRNITISYAKGEWIFILDADEELENANELVELFKSIDTKKINTIGVLVKNPSNLTSKEGYMISMSPRLFKNDGDFKYIGAVHNQPLFKEPIYYSNISIWHYGYITNDKALMEKKYKRTASILQEELKKNPNNLYYRYQLGVSYSMYGEINKALEEFRKAYELLKNKKSQDKFVYSYIYSAYAREAYRNEKYREVIEVTEEGIKIRNDFIDLYYLKGFASYKLGLINEAINTFDKYLKLNDDINNLNIIKDMSISLYNIDNNSKDNVYLVYVQYYLENKNYDDAYKFAKKISDNKRKIYEIINILIKDEKIDELKNVYLNINIEEEKKYFEFVLEEQIDKIEKEKAFLIRKTFSQIENNYGKLCLSIMSDNLLEVYNFIKSLELDKEPIYYFKLFNKLKENMEVVIKLLKVLNPNKQRNVINFLINRYEFEEHFKKYLHNVNFNIRDLQMIVLLKIILEILLTNYVSNTDIIINEYYELFLKYIDVGTIYIENMYQTDKIRLNYKYVESNEIKFLMIFYLIKVHLSKKEYKIAFKYLKEIIEVQPNYARLIQMYMEKIDFELKNN
ncbi:glycosyltransferase [Caloramator sp. CAR-1]|uniref:TPR domain-containing glycosyltransferase n=2 Tax=unclassified Caloramator TaxID=2629145 RepID=UPI0026E41507|nr:TPR domain-containing glycosyltransferase [Caloramator sp. CAR-1]MDO6355387.1 glycosyltransferase [Caloramator sp. CAR-1]